MKIAVTSNGPELDAQASPVFGRCPWYLFVDSDTMEVEALENPATGAASGAGIQAAQFVVEQGADVVLSGNVGPNAFDIFRSADVPVYVSEGGTVREAVQAYKEGRLREAGGATGPAHAGLGRGPGMGRGAPRGGRAQGPAPGAEARSTPVTPAEKPTPADARSGEVAELKEMAADLRKQLAEVMDRLEKLEEGE